MEIKRNYVIIGKIIQKVRDIMQKKARNKLVMKNLIPVSTNLGLKLMCQQTKEVFTFESEEGPVQENVFLKVIHIKNGIYEIYRLNGECYIYDSKRKQIIGADNEYLDLEHLNVKHIAGNLYHFSNKEYSYLYDSSLKEMIGSHPKVIHIKGANNRIQIHMDEGAFLYDTMECTYLSPIFDYLGVFKIKTVPNTDYTSIEAPFTTYLESNKENHIDGKIDVNGAFIGDLILTMNGTVSIHSLEDNYASFDIHENKDYYLKFIEGCKRNLQHQKKR